MSNAQPPFWRVTMTTPAGADLGDVHVRATSASAAIEQLRRWHNPMTDIRFAATRPDTPTEHTTMRRETPEEKRARLTILTLPLTLRIMLCGPFTRLEVEAIACSAGEDARAEGNPVVIDLPEVPRPGNPFESELAALSPVILATMEATREGFKRGFKRCAEVNGMALTLGGKLVPPVPTKQAPDLTLVKSEELPDTDDPTG